MSPSNACHRLTAMQLHLGRHSSKVGRQLPTHTSCLTQNGNWVSCDGQCAVSRWVTGAGGRELMSLEQQNALQGCLLTGRRELIGAMNGNKLFWCAAHVKPTPHRTPELVITAACRIAYL